MEKLHAFMLAAAAVISLTGCDQLHEHFASMAIDHEPTLVFPAGFKMLVDGKPVLVAGFDECPKADPLMNSIFGSDPLAGSHDCIVLSKDRKRVEVQVADSKGFVTEKWTIIRETRRTGNRPFSRTRLKRPDGSFVIPIKS